MPWAADFSESIESMFISLYISIYKLKFIYKYTYISIYICIFLHIYKLKYEGKRMNEIPVYDFVMEYINNYSGSNMSDRYPPREPSFTSISFLCIYVQGTQEN